MPGGAHLSEYGLRMKALPAQIKMVIDFHLVPVTSAELVLYRRGA